jgi:flotillin
MQTEAVKNFPMEIMVVWDGGGSGGVSDLGKRLMGMLPPMHELARLAGLELPEFLGRAAPGQKDEPEKAAASQSTQGTSIFRNQRLSCRQKSSFVSRK